MKKKRDIGKIVDNIVNCIITVSVIATFLGVFIAIWFGIIGLKIAGTGLTLFAMAYMINWIFKQLGGETN